MKYSASLILRYIKY